MEGRKASGGRGGHAWADGDNSSAEGGQGGDAVLGGGGPGGDAMVTADKSRAVGGRGGRGGVGPGSRGGDALVLRDAAALERASHGGKAEEADEAGGGGGEAFAVGENFTNVFVVGGQGGEASQPDGRGGRGGRAYMPPETRDHLGLSDRAHMRWPYFEPITQPGRGGDSPDTPQYMARRLIVERLKRGYFRSQSLPLHEVWWDRQVVPLTWINKRLEAEGHHWRASVVDEEYEFADVARRRDITA